MFKEDSAQRTFPMALRTHIQQCDWIDGRSDKPGDKRFPRGVRRNGRKDQRSEEHTSELQSRVDISYAVFCLKKQLRKTRPGAGFRCQLEPPPDLFSASA